MLPIKISTALKKVEKTLKDGSKKVRIKKVRIITIRHIEEIPW
jgi:hypothetical protein